MTYRYPTTTPIGASDEETNVRKGGKLGVARVKLTDAEVKFCDGKNGEPWLVID